MFYGDLQTGLFGTGEDHPLFDGLIGDYLAAAVGETALSSAKLYKGQHAGLSINYSQRHKVLCVRDYKTPL